MPFDSPIVVVARRGDDRWTLTHPLTYYGAHDKFVIKAGYTTDFATVPRCVVWLIPRFGRYTLAAILHDWLIDNLPSNRFTSRDVDGLFRRVMRELDVPPLRRWLMWCGVRWAALFNAKRRPGWIYDAVPVLALTVVAAPIVVPAAVFVLLGLAVYAVLEAIVVHVAGLS